MATYRAINTINCNGCCYEPGQVIDPCEAVSEASLKQWHKKGLVSLDGEATPARDLMETSNAEIETGKSRKGRSLPKGASED